MQVFLDIFSFIVNTLIFVYAFTVISSYVILAVISAFALKRYIKNLKLTDYDRIISSPFAPSVSVVAPAFNESATITENIRSLLSLYYHDFEVVIVNDGSTDDTLQKVIDLYNMEPVDYAVHYAVDCKRIRGVYKSKNKSFSRLTLVDKENGGKADALNAGINISSNDYFLAIDVDSLVEHDALLKLIKPLLDETDKKVIATGGVVRIANSCTIKGGQVIKARVPSNIWARFQVLEYTRAFLMGRMAWSKLNGLLIISGAVGMFDKEIVIACGGYFTKTVGEDMELVVRMRKYMEKKGLAYKVAYVPDPLLWTEAPEDARILKRQRNRWTRGTIDTIMLHKDLFFNPKYGIMGMLSFPYWVFFEWLAPIIEVLGFAYFIFLFFAGSINWYFFLLLLAFVYGFAVAFSTYSILFEELTYHRYHKKRDVLKLFLIAWIEPFFYQPINMMWAIAGNWDYFVRKKSGWGTMKRKGFK
ncbi:MAG: glycosyltransferase family 2 protein [Bacteroidales bacterium]|nr:glycosyltransferase family 2 protein [Bacteroidales bacterium]